MKPTFGCVYKTGGDYSATDVIRLKANIERHTSMDFQFVCFTDDPVLLPTDVNGVTDEFEADGEGHWAKPLINNWPGWWSVPELYRLTGPVMVTGLDTIFVGPVDPFFELAQQAQDEFYMIHAFKKKEVWASGFMAWNGDWTWLYNEMKYPEEADKYKWESRYTKGKLAQHEIEIRGVQDYIDGIYSYKHHCRREGRPPKDARAILFHGRPRPSKVKQKWVKRQLRI